MIEILKSFNGFNKGCVIKFNDAVEAALVEKGIAKYCNEKKVIKKKEVK